MSTKVNKKSCSDECVVNFSTRLPLYVLVNGEVLTLHSHDLITIRRRHSGHNVVFIEVVGLAPSFSPASSD